MTSLLLCAASIGWTAAQQVEFYNFESKVTGTYSPLENATVIGLSDKVKGEAFGNLIFNATDTTGLSEEYSTDNPAYMEGIPLGFDFRFGGKVYDKFVVSGQGYVLFGEKESPEVAIGGTNLQISLGIAPWLGIATCDPVFGLDGTKISYKKEGTSPDASLTVEFSGMAYLSETPEATFNYQIKLNENGSSIEMLFDGFTIPEDAFQWYLGMKDGFGSTHYRSPEGAQGAEWTESSRTEYAATWCGGSSFEEGTLYSFTLPDECQAPTEHITEVVLSPFSEEMTIDVFVDTTGYAEGYLILGSDKPIEGTPDGYEYDEGESVLGARVVAVGSLDEFDNPSPAFPNSRTHFSFTQEGLEPNTAYYYAAYLYNFQCTNTKYTQAVTAQAKTRPDRPDSLEISSIGLDQMEFRIDAQEGSDILIAVTTAKGVDYTGVNRIYLGDFGLPADTAEAGDTIWKEEMINSLTGETRRYFATVLYAGPAEAELGIPVRLDDNTIYYFGAFTKGADGQYSSTFAPAYGITPAQIPFEDHFENMSAAEDNPFIGWNGTEGFELMLSGMYPDVEDGSATATFEANEPGSHQEAVLVLPPLDFPTDSNVLFHVNYSMDPWNLTLTEGDSIVFELSVDGGNTFEKLRAVHYQTVKPYPSDIIVSGHAGAKQAILRVRAVSYNPESWGLTVNSIEVDGIAFCDVPKSLRVDSYNVVGGNLRVVWSPSLNEESEWNISLARPDGQGCWEEWSSAEVVQESASYWLSGLADNTLYKARVRAVCGPGNNSEWVEAEILSGRVPTFTENFDNLTPGTSEYYDPFDLPPYWSCDNSMYDGVEDTIDYSPYSSDVEAYDWKTANEPVPGQSNAAIAYHFNNLEYGVEMLVSPTIELIPADGSFLTFDIAYGSIDDQGAYQALTEAQPGHRLELWVSVDSGRSFVTTRPLQVWDSTQLLALQGDQAVSIDLEGYQGGVAFAFAFFGNSGGESDPIVWIDNFGITNNCPVARGLDIDLNTLTAQNATIRWVADKTVEEWIVKLASPEGVSLYTTSEDEYSFSGLQEETDYMAYVGHLCGTDTSEWASVEFSTPGAECAPIAGLTVSNVTRNAATLTYEGEAGNYRIRIRPVGGTEWAYYTTEALTYTFNNLEMETEYEGGVQSRCSMASSDTSEWVAFANFTTLGITCFAPTDFFVDTTTYSTASFHWNGTSERYQVEWSLRNDDEAAGRMVFDGTSGTIIGLSAETNYQARVRGICSAGDTSDWSEIRQFATTQAPGCPVPTDLRVESVTETSASLLWSVSGEVEVASFTLRYRASSGTWDSVQDIEAMQYELTGLEPQTAYLWSVLSACTDGRYSGWGMQARFETGGTANESADESGLFLTASRHQLHVMNPGAVRIERIRVYTLGGSLAEDYVIRSNENVILTTGLSMQVAVVEVLTADGPAFRFKVLLP